MKKTVLTGVAALTLFDIAGAQPALADPAASWDGKYAGVHVGLREGDADFRSSPFAISQGGNPATVPARTGAFDPGGIIGGVQGGINRLVGRNRLIGVEGDFSFGSHSDSLTASNSVVNGDGTSFIVQNASLELGWQATLRGRVGVTQGPWLFFATGGIAFLDSEWRDTYTGTPGTPSPVTPVPASASNRDSEILVGWVAGGGIARQWRGNKSVRVDFLYEDFGDRNVPSGTGQTSRLDISAFKVRFGLNFKLGPGRAN